MWQFLFALIALIVAILSGIGSYNLARKNEPAWAIPAALLMLAFVVALLVALGLGLWGAATLFL